MELFLGIMRNLLRLVGFSSLLSRKSEFLLCLGTATIKDPMVVTEG